ncbi:Ribosomal RNA small subunit methyltransferase H [Oleidesulfovibrio alaskensis G20]|uniref:Ribosomal RNA small subunit methyltransferase H n=1 Tax=Oleidesulfovibrio alaskensis (strain ATCC BAA-1058 / DSM 17464 / G20) TaxID=207559 RepID=RSMH_OLEA2|nr:16S rRNA (cytosine(1402)-N(4))-methyltransferase RsmH [Oleidesulfovibrio alaskensis]Q313R1.1 RecName: Full=Ribosomal RNA small subunit methyltransferase H; AltName: Full=16S rRNA m(4)C1402 methyltransferase; AltName: Full=rRNA (cytosine-N(4)-)-methyltransferase RsmH [Oleidesulfovibrio alaskensis G20]ABB37835.1 Ribosomal RNA small subunit methyltransferase H [Oleidesulfovibrio alaskensis G20]MBG0773706.1 16S rRNA (cytosine(1402)-N(4))-methyltransferase RsmH [Oleidesulfovibrio alaskensis]MBL35
MTADNGHDNNRHQYTAHVPVLLDEVLHYLSPVRGGRYLDGTLGLGGHSEAIMNRCGGDAWLLGLDRDREALAAASGRLAPFGDRVTTRYACYSQFAAIMDEIGWTGLDGALIDIGVSSMQIDTPSRGFSFYADGPLDMRMDPSGDMPSAGVLVNTGSVERLKEIISTYGEDPMAGRIARAIVDARARNPIETTARLAEVVESAYPAKWRAKSRNHPATRTFQALRMAVNGELEELETFLAAIVDRMNPGGRIVVITFHSLEDRLVKNAFRDEAKGCLCPRHIPVCVCGKKPRVNVLTRKPVTAGQAELQANSRASSAKLRAAERI